MKIALIGYGKMGQLIEQVAIERGHTIVAKISPKCSQKAITEESVKGAEACIDFSSPHSIMENIHAAANLGKSLIVGTTGWHNQLEEVKRIVKNSNIGFLYSANFSMGVNLFLAIVAEASKLMNNFPSYDVGMIEAHHSKKLDSPSGTAIAIASQVLENIKRKTKIITEPPRGQVDAEALSIASIRCGSIPGTHSVIFDSAVDTITLTHEARNREGFAQGAVAAVEWLGSKKGFFTIEDMFRG